MATVAPTPPIAPPPTTAVRALACPNCGGGVELRAAGLSVSLICPHCGSTLDATQGDLQLLVAAQAALKKPLIPLGTRGRLDEIDWEAVGYMERSSEDGGWAEYLLFNPYRGYRWLVASDGRYGLGRVLDRAPLPSEEDVAIGSLRYELVEDPYPATVDFVVGEFPWRVQVGETVTVTDYEASGGRALSAEANEAERTWTLTQRLGYGVAEEAFGVAADPQGAYRGPSPFGPYLKPLWQIGGVVVVLLLLVQAISGPSRTVLLRQDVALTVDAPERTVVMGPITIDRARSAMTVHSATGRLDNAWVDLDYSLVERGTQARYDAYGVAEEYHGRDSDGYWSEGNGAPDTRFAGIPRGTYDLVLDVSAHHWAGATVPPRVYTAQDNSSLGFSGDAGRTADDGFKFSLTFGAQPSATPAPPPPPPGSIDLRVTVRRGATFGGNFWLAALLVALWPVYALYRHLRFFAGSGTVTRDEED